jgi:hypothetical protein
MQTHKFCYTKQFILLYNFIALLLYYFITCIHLGVGVQVLVASRIFSKSYRLALKATQPLIQFVPGKKRPGREDDHPPLTSPEVKKTWTYTSTPQNTFSWHSA